MRRDNESRWYAGRALRYVSRVVKKLLRRLIDVRYRVCRYSRVAASYVLLNAMKPRQRGTLISMEHMKGIATPFKARLVPNTEGSSQ